MSLPGGLRSPRPTREAPPARPLARFVSRFGACARNAAEGTPSRAADGNFDAVLGPAQFKLRTPQAI
eukprot:358100-Alexandrium_andersonii.AAC.1